MTDVLEKYNPKAWKRLHENGPHLLLYPYLNPLIQESTSGPFVRNLRDTRRTKRPADSYLREICV